MDKLAQAIANLARSSQVFNEIAGKDGNYSYDAIHKQFNIIASEFEELSKGAKTNDVEEVLDGGIDVMVTIVGLMLQLQSSGIDVAKACKRIAENNLSKYTKYLQEAEASVKHYRDKGVTVDIEYNPEYDVFVLKDLQGKVRKPVSFKDVYIQDLIPEELLLNGFPKTH